MSTDREDQTPTLSPALNAKRSARASRQNYHAFALEHYISERLRFIRRLSGFSQQYVADQVGLSYQQMQKYERGETRLSAALLAEFSGLFYLPIDWFIGPYILSRQNEWRSGCDPYVDIINHLFHMLRTESKQECSRVISQICEFAQCDQRLEISRIATLRHSVRNGTVGEGASILKFVQLLAGEPRNAVTGSSRSSRPLAETVPNMDTGEANVLLVDDDPDVLRTVSASLRAAGFSVTGACDGHEALVILHSDLHVDAVVTDLAMVGMDGVELLAQATQLRAGLPGIVISGYAGAERLADLPPYIEALNKPFRRMELVGHLRLLLEKRRNNSPAEGVSALVRESMQTSGDASG